MVVFQMVHWLLMPLIPEVILFDYVVFQKLCCYYAFRT